MNSIPAVTDITHIALVGAGVIGSGWAARCLANGMDVSVTDPDASSESKLRAAVDAAWPLLEEIGMPSGASRARLAFESNIEKAVANADFVQENVPARATLKTDVHAEISRHTRPGVVVASSSSGLLPSDIQSQSIRPESHLVGHPFAPVYLLPLGEVVGGEKTNEQAINAAGTFYASIGMRPLRVRKEIDAYIADRLQEAIWREALHLINDGIASVAEIDAAITGGPGLRWAFMGTLLGWHLGSGPGGMRQNLAQFGPALELPWCNMQAPELTEALQTRIIEGCDQETGQRPFAELEKKRDRCLMEIQKVLAQHWYPPGEDGWPDFQSPRETSTEPST